MTALFFASNSHKQTSTAQSSEFPRKAAHQRLDSNEKQHSNSDKSFNCVRIYTHSCYTHTAHVRLVVSCRLIGASLSWAAATTTATVDLSADDPSVQTPCKREEQSDDSLVTPSLCPHRAAVWLTWKGGWCILKWVCLCVPPSRWDQVWVINFTYTISGAPGLNDSTHTYSKLQIDHREVICQNRKSRLNFFKSSSITKSTTSDSTNEGRKSGIHIWL